MASTTIRETSWGNPYWRRFEARNERGEVKKEVFVSESGRVIVRKHGFFGTSEKEYHVDPRVPGGIVDLLG